VKGKKIVKKDVRKSRARKEMQIDKEREEETGIQADRQRRYKTKEE